MTRTPPFSATIHNNADLAALWAQLMGSGRFGKRSIWLVFLDRADRTLPAVIPIDDIPAEPNERMSRNLASLAYGVIADGEAASVVLLLSRPGPSSMTAQDRRWAQALRSALGGQLGRWPIHLATTDRIQTFAPDDLIAAS
jgi:hypothetical protein